MYGITSSLVPPQLLATHCASDLKKNGAESLGHIQQD